MVYLKIEIMRTRIVSEKILSYVSRLQMNHQWHEMKLKQIEARVRAGWNEIVKMMNKLMTASVIFAMITHQVRGPGLLRTILKTVHEYKLYLFEYNGYNYEQNGSEIVMGKWEDKEILCWSQNPKSFWSDTPIKFCMNRVTTI